MAIDIPEIHNIAKRIRLKKCKDDMRAHDVFDELYLKAINEIKMVNKSNENLTKFSALCREGDDDEN